MNIDDVRKILVKSNSENNFRITVPSTKESFIFGYPTVGMRKSLAKFSVANDYAGNLEFQIAKLGFIKALCPEINIDTLTELDFIYILAQIRKNTSTDNITLNITCPFDDCENKFEYDLDLDYTINQCEKFEFNILKKTKTIAEKEFMFILKHPKIKHVLELEQYLFNNFENQSEIIKNRNLNYPYLCISEIYCDGQSIEDFNQNKMNIIEKINFIEEFPDKSEILEGKDSIFSIIINDLKILEEYSIFNELRCPKCNEIMEGVLTTDNFFTF